MLESETTLAKPTFRAFLQGWPRARGLLVLGVGVFLFVLGVVGPLQEAKEGATSVRIHLIAVAMSPLSLALGATYLLLGNRAERVFGLSTRPTVAGTTLMWSLFGLGLVLVGWMLLRL